MGGGIAVWALLVAGLLTSACSGAKHLTKGCDVAGEGPARSVRLAPSPQPTTSMLMNTSFIVMVPRGQGFGPLRSSNERVAATFQPTHLAVALNATQYDMATNKTGVATLSAIKRSAGKPDAVYSAVVAVPCH